MILPREEEKHEAEEEVVTSNRDKLSLHELTSLDRDDCRSEAAVSDLDTWRQRSLVRLDSYNSDFFQVELADKVMRQERTNAALENIQVTLFSFPLLFTLCVWSYAFIPFFK